MTEYASAARDETKSRPMTPDLLLLTDRVAVVTGAARGIGKATALSLAALGAKVAICDKLPQELAESESELRAAEATVVNEVLDVRRGDLVENFLARTESELGRIDILINNAGGGFWAPFADITAGGEAALVSENFGTVTNCVRSALPRMNDGASIVNVTSVEAYHSAPGFAVYAAMKAAAVSYTHLTLPTICSV